MAGLLAVAGVVVGNLVLVRYVGVGDSTLIAAAAGTGLGTSIALGAIGSAMYSRFGAFMPISTTVRGAIAGSDGCVGVQVSGTGCGPRQHRWRTAVHARS